MTNFSVRKNDYIEAFSTMFASKEEAQRRAAKSSSVTFVSQHYAAVMGFPCGGWAVINAFGKPQEMFVKEL